jgi:ubiquinone/menaquinone biosynthesis C-methylase UbiE
MNNDFSNESKNYFYRNYYKKDLLKLEPNLYLKNILDGFNILNKSFLEVGCGSGNNLNWLSKNFQCDCTGVEPNKEIIDYLKRTYSNINFSYGDISNIPFQNNFFDVVISRSVLHWVNRNKILQSLGELIRVSKKYIIISDFYPKDPFKIKYKHKKNFYTFHIDYIPILISTGIIEIVKENIGRIVVENNSDTFKKVNEEEWESGKYDYDIVKTTLLRKNFTNLTEKKESDFK